MDQTPWLNRTPDPNPENYWVVSGETVEELTERLVTRLASYAERTGGFRLQPAFKERLTRTIKRFNEFARNGHDDDFHRGETDVELDWNGPHHAVNDKNPTMWPLSDAGPYHCIILAGSVLDTNGGPCTNPLAQVVRRDGSVIRGLYGAGNCVAAPAGAAYWSGGSTLGPAATFAWIAAKQLAEEPKRTVKRPAAAAPG